jgi:hypothetical protein
MVRRLDASGGDTLSCALGAMAVVNLIPNAIW